MSTVTSTAADAGEDATSPDRVGSFRATWWAVERLVTTPWVLLLAGAVGAVQAVSVSLGEPSSAVATLPLELYPVALLYGYVGYEFGDFLDLHDLLFYEIFGAIRLGLLGLVFGAGVALTMLLLIPLGILGVFLFVVVWALLFVNFLLLAPAVCIDEGVISAVGKAWELADEARWTVFGILVLTLVPIAAIRGAVGGADVTVLAATGVPLGLLNAVFHLALGRVYIGQRTAVAN